MSEVSYLKQSDPEPMDERVEWDGHSTMAAAAPEALPLPRPTRFRSHVRFFGFPLRTPTLLLGLIEAGVLLAFASATLGAPIWVTPAASLPAASMTIAILLAALAMGLYSTPPLQRSSVLLLRGAIASLVLAPGALIVLSLLATPLDIPAAAYGLTALAAMAVFWLDRRIVPHLINPELFQRRVLILGSGQQALRAAAQLTGPEGRISARLIGFVPGSGPTLLEDSRRTPRLELAGRTLRELCLAEDVDEIIIAQDERRGAGGLPVDALLDCKFDGIAVTDLSSFLERETGTLEIAQLRPSWLVFSQGFAQPLRKGSKRAFDVLVSLGLLASSWPLMLLAALAIKLEDGWRAPVFYRQARVGLNGRSFDVVKFRSMRTDAEQFGQAQWAEADDPRVTRVGRILRKARLDELPQLANILKGDMAFVGPRPERPVFVKGFNGGIPFYAERHRVKPGLTGWAQINYPYGASAEDARRKLEYDLYYVKNYSLLLDLLILIRTVEVVLIGKGAR